EGAPEPLLGRAGSLGPARDEGRHVERRLRRAPREARAREAAEVLEVAADERAARPGRPARVLRAGELVERLHGRPRRRRREGGETAAALLAIAVREPPEDEREDRHGEEPEREVEDERARLRRDEGALHTHGRGRLGETALEGGERRERDPEEERED